MDNEIILNKNKQLQPKQLEGLSKIAAANTIAQTLSYSLERKYLQPLSMEDRLCHLKLNGVPSHLMTGYHWMRISQVGRFASNSKQNCFDAMQTILHSCNLPDTSLAFLILGDNGIFSLYIGVRGRGRISALQDFVASNWKGVISKKSDNDPTLKGFFETDKYEKCHILTGVPTLNAQDQYAHGIDQIIGGSKQHKHIAYLVTATPIAEENIDGILTECREIQSQAESFKGFSISESLQKSESTSDSHTVAETITETVSNEVKQNDGKAVRNTILAVTGLAVAAAILYPPALAIVPQAAQRINSIPKLKSSLNILNMGSQMQSMAIAKGLIPRQTAPKKDKSTSTATTDATTHGFSESYTQSVSQTISNAHIEATVEHLKKHAERFQLGKATGMWEVGCYVFTDSDENGVTASQVKAVLSGAESIYEPVRVHDASELFTDNDGYIRGFKECAQIYSQYVPENGFLDEPFRHPFGKDFSRLTTFLTTKELSCLINLPMNSVPGISVVDIWPDFSLTPQETLKHNSLKEIGKLIYDHQETTIPVGIDLNTFSRHSLVSGVNGSGKTNTVLSVVESFMELGKPIMIFEPAKTEYVDWAIEYNKNIDAINASISDSTKKRRKIRLFIPSCNYYAKGKLALGSPLRLNPFEVIPSKNEQNGYRVVSHLDKLKSVLAGAFPMQDILPTVIERLLYKIYTDSGWLNDEPNAKTPTKFPTLTSINKVLIKDLMEQLGYAEENTMNISAALRTRFNSMKQGWKGELLNNERIEGISWEELFETPCIINLSYVGDDSDKAFIMSLIMQYLYEYRVAESEADNYSFNDNECRHLVVIEEAHRVMTKCESPELPQYRSNQMFASILSEVRAYGQGLMVVDQVPSRLIEDAVKNTNIKIIHKIVSADDTKMLAESVGMTSEQQLVIPRLSIGQAILVGLNSLNVDSQNAGDIYLAKINKKK
jgi:DNA helicase HerA-like ATPase